jgi:hypothetical protein
MGRPPGRRVFRDTIAFRWQDADDVASDERFDSSHLIHDSEWLAVHLRQSYATPEHRHLKLNFNAEGTRDLLCTTVDRLK